MSSPKVSIAVYGIIENSDGEILFQKRKNTGFADGYLQLPSGHLETEPSESVVSGCVRELEEEIGIQVQEDDLELLFTHHSYGSGTKNYLGFFFCVKGYSGNISNMEPDKCEFLEWIHPRDFGKKNIIKYVKECIIEYKQQPFTIRAKKYDHSSEYLG